jgi:hypothetical protein
MGWTREEPPMSAAEAPRLETDPRFPSGPWTGFFLQRLVPGRHQMELRLTFRQGLLTGQGRDWVGLFAVQGHYAVADGRCTFTKSYVGKHNVYYKGFNEGKGIWGVWEINDKGYLPMRGGFHIWPEGMPDPSQPTLSEHADLPRTVEEKVQSTEPQMVPVGAVDEQ